MQAWMLYIICEEFSHKVMILSSPRSHLLTLTITEWLYGITWSLSLVGSGHRKSPWGLSHRQNSKLKIQHTWYVKRNAQEPVLYDWFNVQRSQVAHYNDITMGSMVSQITSLTIVYSTVYSSADQRKHQSSASLAFVRGIHRGPVNSPHKWPVTRKMFPFDDVIMFNGQ